MAANSKIEWTHHTINWWQGCVRVGPGCEHCYAEAQDARFHKRRTGMIHTENGPGYPVLDQPHWGLDAPRLLRVEAATREAFSYQRRAKEEGVRFRVFTNSMSDFFEDRRDLDAARLCALDTIRLTPDLDWMILTKRPEKILELLKRAEADAAGSGFSDWLRDWIHGKAPANVWLGATTENQEWADKRIPELVKVPAAVRFLSVEPMLGPVCLAQNLPDERVLRWCHWMIGMVDWVICGGESGPCARPMHPDWARSLRNQCKAAGVSYFHKQNGEFLDLDTAQNILGDDDPRLCDGQRRAKAKLVVLDDTTMVRVGRKDAGRLLDGMEHSVFPEVLP